jgi:Protein of unknown function (DUF2384)
MPAGHPRPDPPPGRKVVGGGAARSAAGKSTARLSGYARIVEDMRLAGLTAEEIAVATGVHLRQVQNWATGSKPRGATQERLLDLEYLVKQLSEVYTAEGVTIWLHSRNRLLQGRRPLDLLADGHIDDVLAVVDRLVEGTT